jgi:hypothetical protein
MRKKSLTLLALVLLIASLGMTTSTAQEGKKKAPLKLEEVPEVSREAREAQEGAELLITALKLKQYGWGTQFKGTFKDESLDALITAARILKKLPAPGALGDDVKVEAGKEKGAPKGTTVKLARAEEFNPGQEASTILKRAREVLTSQIAKGTLDKKKAEAYETLIAEVESLPAKVRSVAGGPKVVRREIQPGQWHSYEWKWEMYRPGMVAFNASQQMRLMVVQADTNTVYADSVTTSTTPQFIPGGYGKPMAGKVANVTVRVVNVGQTPGNYVLAAH